MVIDWSQQTTRVYSTDPLLIDMCGRCRRATNRSLPTILHECSYARAARHQANCSPSILGLRVVPTQRFQACAYFIGGSRQGDKVQPQSVQSALREPIARRFQQTGISRPSRPESHSTLSTSQLREQLLRFFTGQFLPLCYPVKFVISCVKPNSNGNLSKPIRNLARSLVRRGRVSSRLLALGPSFLLG